MVEILVVGATNLQKETRKPKDKEKWTPDTNLG
jgi:hypothetical protein